MIMDSLAEFADAVSVAAGTGTANIGSQIDLSVVRDVGNGQPVYLVITCDTSIITGGSAGTIQFQLASDASASIATNGDQSIHWTSKAFVTDGDDANEIDAGAVIAVVPLPLGALEPYERYIGVQAVIASQTVTAGKINAFLTLDPHGWTAMPDATN